MTKPTLQWRVIRGFSFFVPLFFATGCTLESYQEGSARVSLRLQRDASFLEQAGRELFARVAPASASGFDCVAVNVSGAGIASADDRTSEYPLNKLSGCGAYPGITSDLMPMAAATEANLVVRRGADRAFQVVGIQSKEPCKDNYGKLLVDLRKEGSKLDKYGHIYQLGLVNSAVENEVTIEIPNTYNRYSQSLRECDGPSALSPAQISSLKIWLRADHYFKNTDGDSLLNAGSEWRNEVENGADVDSVSHTLGSVIFQATSGPSNRPNVEFSSSHSSRSSSLNMGAVVGLTAVVVAKLNSATSATLICLTPGSACISPYPHFTISGSGGYFSTMTFDGSNLAQTTPLNGGVGTWGIFIGTFAANNKIQLRLITSSSDVTHEANITQSAIGLGSGGTFFVGTGGGGILNGSIAEIMVFDQNLTSGFLNWVLEYLAFRYQIDGTRSDRSRDASEG